MPNTTMQSLPYPALADAANGPVAFQNLAQAVEKIAVAVYASVADRTAKCATPVEGMMCYLKDTNTWAYYDGSAWIALYMPTNAAWTAFTPVITASTTNPNMTTAGRYRRDGKTLYFQFAITDVVSLGSGTYTVSLPATVSASLPGGDTPIGMAKYRTNAGVYVLGQCCGVASASGFSVLIPGPNGPSPNLARWGSGSPSGQVNGDTWAFAGCYETT